jgi:hypothetical protein
VYGRACCCTRKASINLLFLGSSHTNTAQRASAEGARRTPTPPTPSALAKEFESERVWVGRIRGAALWVMACPKVLCTYCPPMD